MQYTGDTVYAVLENVPDGLTAKYLNNDGISVGDNSIVTVTFELAEEYSANYEKPTQGGKGVNYIYSGSGDFEWSKKWEVVKAEISIEWKTEDYTDNDGNTFLYSNIFRHFLLKIFYSYLLMAIHTLTYLINI